MLVLQVVGVYSEVQLPPTNTVLTPPAVGDSMLYAKPDVTRLAPPPPPHDEVPHGGPVEREGEREGTILGEPPSDCHPLGWQNYTHHFLPVCSRFVQHLIGQCVTYILYMHSAQCVLLLKLW